MSIGGSSMKPSENVRRIIALIGIVLMIATLVSGPVGIRTVQADGGGTGHPPPDSTVKCVDPASEIGAWTSIGLYLTSLSSMLL